MKLHHLLCNNVACYIGWHIGDIDYMTLMTTAPTFLIVKTTRTHMDLPASTKHLYNICTTSAQSLRRWFDIVQMLYKCFVFAGMDLWYPMTNKSNAFMGSAMNAVEAGDQSDWTATCCIIRQTQNMCIRRWADVVQNVIQMFWVFWVIDFTQNTPSHLKVSPHKFRRAYH